MNLILYADTETSTDLFSAIPASIGDPFLYVETGGRRVAVIASLDAGTVRAAAPGVEVIDPETYGRRELALDGTPRLAAGLEVARRALADLGVREAIIPWRFPVALADVLRADGVQLTVDGDAVDARRRVKTPAQLEGIRRAQRAADAAMGLARDLIHAAADGLTCEGVREQMAAVCAEHGADLPGDVIVGPNEQGAAGHDAGSGPIVPGDVVIVDIWPRDRLSRCWADMTRTFVAGGGAPDAEIRTYWELTREALAVTTAATRAGAHGRDLHFLACDVYERAGQPTGRTGPGPDGFFHGLGHGVGLDVHEAPGLGLTGDELVAGDVITLEPGCYRSGYGGVRLEDLLLVTDDGYEVLTQFGHEL